GPRTLLSFSACPAMKAYQISGKLLLQLGSDERILRCRVIVGAQHVGFAADLAIFTVTLLPSRGFIHDDRVPFAAARTLIASFHCCLPKNAAEAPAHYRKLRQDFRYPACDADLVLG